MIAISVLSCAWAVLVLLPLLYLGLLTLLSVPRRAPVASKLAKFVVVVPAHNEEAQIATTVQSLKAVDYPAELFDVLVVADNCTDATAAHAEAAGARVLQRQNDQLRGKGYALEYAFDTILTDPTVDAAVVVDADTVVSRSLLRAFAARLELGFLAVQAEYGVRNPDASWRTRLMAVALGMFHRLRSLGRERLEVSAGLRGNGMCFATKLLREHPHKAFGLVEDVESTASPSGSVVCASLTPTRRRCTAKWSPRRRRRRPSGSAGRAVGCSSCAKSCHASSGARWSSAISCSSTWPWTWPSRL